MSKEKLETKKYVIAKELAEKEFDRLCQLWDIDNDTELMNKEDSSGFNAQRAPIVIGFMTGRLALEDNGVLSVKLMHSKKTNMTVLNLDPDKADFLSMDNFSSGENYHKIRALTASMAGITIGSCASISPKDDKVIQKVVSLFLAS